MRHKSMINGLWHYLCLCTQSWIQISVHVFNRMICLMRSGWTHSSPQHVQLYLETHPLHLDSNCCCLGSSLAPCLQLHSCACYCDLDHQRRPALAWCMASALQKALARCQLHSLVAFSDPRPSYAAGPSTVLWTRSTSLDCPQRAFLRRVPRP